MPIIQTCQTCTLGHTFLRWETILCTVDCRFTNPDEFLETDYDFNFYKITDLDNLVFVDKNWSCKFWE